MKSGTFKTVVRSALCLTAIGALLLIAHFQDLGDQYGVVDYFTFAVSNVKSNRPHESKPIDQTTEDKVIVMAKMEQEDTSWVADELPECVELHALTLRGRNTDSSLAGSALFTLSTPPQARQKSSPPVSTRAMNPWLTSHT